MNAGFFQHHQTPPVLQTNAALRVVHFLVEDSPALQTAVAELVRAAENSTGISALLVADKTLNVGSLHRTFPEVPFQQLGSWSRVGRAYEFYRLCRDYRANAVFIHGRGTNHWSRYASLRAGVAHVVDSNSGMAPCGIELEPFSLADDVPLRLRIPGIIMPSGFDGPYALQLIRALACLREMRLYPRVFLTGPGSQRDHANAERLARALGLDNQIRIAEHCGNLPFLLMHHQIAVVGAPAQHPIQVAQAMAAGCALIGVDDGQQPALIQQDQDGILLAGDSPELLAEKLQHLLKDLSYATQIAQRARKRAHCEFSLHHMQQVYQQIYQQLSSGFPANQAAA